MVEYIIKTVLIYIILIISFAMFSEWIRNYRGPTCHHRQDNIHELIEKMKNEIIEKIQNDTNVRSVGGNNVRNIGSQIREDFTSVDSLEPNTDTQSIPTEESELIKEASERIVQLGGIRLATTDDYSIVKINPTDNKIESRFDNTGLRLPLHNSYQVDTYAVTPGTYKPKVFNIKDYDVSLHDNYSYL